MKKYSSKRARLERNRYSVFTNDMDTCFFCGRPRVDIHEILYGSNRLNSMKWGYVLPVCRTHHEILHKNHVLTEEWCKKCQLHFQKKYSSKDWLNTFHKNYI